MFVPLGMWIGVCTRAYVSSMKKIKEKVFQKEEKTNLYR